MGAPRDFLILLGGGPDVGPWSADHHSKSPAAGPVKGRRNVTGVNSASWRGTWRRAASGRAGGGRGGADGGVAYAMAPPGPVPEHGRTVAARTRAPHRPAAAPGSRRAPGT
ncbi:hypothetical protein ALMP_05670 [Streptomyces sp. A012304]|nr:hypothetical protein ALMP_05670 [Streptomyces sp. A012304]